MKKIAIVMFDTITSNVCCTSNTFEFRGHICYIFVVFQNKGFRKTWTIHFSWVEKNVREKVMIYEWDEKLFENSIKAHRSNDLYSLFFKNIRDVLQHDETYKKALLENMSQNINNLKK